MSDPSSGRVVRAFAPATVSNLGSGFDVLGLALEGIGDTVEARLVPGSGVRIAEIRGDNGRLPREPDLNTASVAAAATLRKAGVDRSVELVVEKGLPLGSGLGSSAASAAAAALAVNRLVGSPLRRSELVEPCLEAEAVVSGKHADNVAPALLGGLVLVRSVDPLDVIRLPVPDGLWVGVVTPAFELETRRARAVLPQEVPLHAMVEVAAHLGALVAACYANDIELLARSIVDPVVGPAREPLIPGCAAVIGAALAAGAVGSAISGAGPTVFALCRSARSAEEVVLAMCRGFEGVGLAAIGHTSPADAPGARIL